MILKPGKKNNVNNWKGTPRTTERKGVVCVSITRRDPIWWLHGKRAASLITKAGCCWAAWEVGKDLNVELQEFIDWGQLAVLNGLTAYGTINFACFYECEVTFTADFIRVKRAHFPWWQKFDRHEAHGFTKTLDQRIYGAYEIFFNHRHGSIPLCRVYSEGKADRVLNRLQSISEYMAQRVEKGLGTEDYADFDPAENRPGFI